MRMGLSHYSPHLRRLNPWSDCPAVLGQAVQFVYTCWDRIVLSGYIERLQRPENVIYFFRDFVGIDAIEPAVLEQRTNTYKAWVRRITDDRGIPVRGAPRGVRKEELVEPYYRRLKGSEGVACVLSSLEQSRTFVSYMPHRKPPSGDANYRLIKACRKTIPALLLVRAGSRHGADEHPRRQLLSVQRDVLWRAVSGPPDRANRYSSQPREPMQLDLVLVDEADRLKTAAPEQLRDMYDRRHIGLILIGMPGLQKRLARYAQLYSRVGFVHQFHPLSGREFQTVVEHQWVQLGLDSMTATPGPDTELLNTVARITAGNFRLIQRLFAQIERLMAVNNSATITAELIEAARESLGRQRPSNCMRSKAEPNVSGSTADPHRDRDRTLFVCHGGTGVYEQDVIAGGQRHRNFPTRE
jgi:AAA domain